MTVAFYISGHGFGHASRQIEIINALAPRLPAGARIIVRTSVARWLVDRTLTRAATIVPGACDTGIVQIDSLRIDEPATVRATREFYSTFSRRVETEAALLRAHDVRLVIADAPPLACAAAAAAGIRSIVISNFTWDWIYEAYDTRFRIEAPDVLPLIRDAYSLAVAGWRLPMYGGFGTFASIVDLPFVARHATWPRLTVLEALRLPSTRPLVLSSFGGYGLNGFDLQSLDCLDEWTVVVTERDSARELPKGAAFVDVNELYARGFRYEDLIAAADVVATKPGYGIISECVANGTAMLYTSRGRFPEYEVMVRAMPPVLQCAYIEQQALLAGRWREPLNTVRAAPLPSKQPPTNGAQVAADSIVRIVEADA